MSDYAMFELEIMPLGLVVKRNHEDFLRLKDLLSRQYPARLLPYLEK